MKSKKKITTAAIISAFILIILITILFSNIRCTQTKNIVSDRLPKQDTILIINNHKVFINVCNKHKKGTFILLPGWNFPADDWCNKTTLCQKIIEQDYCIVMPDMGKSVYQKKNFPETRHEWRIYPTREWLSDTLIPLLQNKYSLLLKNENNYIVGLSTGARGVALVLLDYPDLFKGAAALSGDYDQLKMPNDNLMTGFYGTINNFRKRWENTDNPISRIKEYNTPIYLGHGKLDKVVPPEQTVMFYDSLKKYHPGLKIKLNMPNTQHNYNYWGSEVDSILKFLEISK
jgi:dienelactone hydrolase